MFNISNEHWQPSNIQQQVLAAKIARLLDNIEARKATVSIVSIGEPTQADWEAAYQRQTGYTAPIPFGVRLVWINSLENKTSYYATSLDNNGIFSTGEIYELVNTENKYLPIRYIASGREIILSAIVRSVFNQFKPNTDTSNPTNSVTVSPKAISSQGLQALLIFFRGVEDDISVFADSADPNNPDVDAGQIGVGGVQAGHNGTTATIVEQRLDSWADQVFSFSRTSIATYHNGVLFLNNVQQFLNGDDIDLTFAGLNGWGAFVSPIGDVSVAGNVTGHFSVFNSFDAKKVLKEGLQLTFQQGRFDVYGIYDQKTANNLSEGKRPHDLF